MAEAENVGRDVVDVLMETEHVGSHCATSLVVVDNDDDVLSWRIHIYNSQSTVDSPSVAQPCDFDRLSSTCRQQGAANSKFQPTPMTNLWPFCQ